MDWVNPFYGFHFDYDSAFDHHVDSVSDFEFLAVIDNWQRDLCCNGETSVSEFVGKARLVSAFKEAWAEDGMDSYGGCDHGACDLVDSKRRRVYGGRHKYCISQLLCVPL